MMTDDNDDDDVSCDNDGNNEDALKRQGRH
jgi:hypothetical protein